MNAKHILTVAAIVALGVTVGIFARGFTDGQGWTTATA
jgi:hypothetical protein